MQVAIYTRLSRDRELQESTARQEKACHDYAAARGWTVAHTYTDVDISAYQRNVHRPGFESVVAHAQRKDIDAVLFWKLDRLVRNHADFERLWSICESNGVQLASVVDPVDTTTEVGMMMVRMLVGFARMESANISLRVKAARESSARKGEPPRWTRRAFGLTEDWTQIVPEEAAAMRDAYTKLLEGWSAYAVARHWNAQGLVSPTGKPWRASTVVQCLSAPRVAAQRVHNGRVVADGNWPAIFTADEYASLQVVLSDPRRRSGGGGPARHLLTGLLFCHCGTSMSVRPKANGTRRYLCRREIGGCGAGIVADPLEALVVEWLFTALEGAQWPTVGDVEGLADRIHADESKLVQLSRDHAEGLIERAEWLAARDVIHDRLAGLRRRVARAQPVRTFTRGDWDERDTPWRRGVLALFFDRIEVGPSAAPRFDPSRVRPVWRV